MPSDRPRESTIDTQAIRDTLMPPGILQADLDPLAKSVGIYLWHLSGCFQQPFICHRGEALSWFAIADGRTAKRVFAALEADLLNVIQETKGGHVKAQFTSQIWMLSTVGNGIQRTLDLYVPSAEFGGNPLLPRLLVPEQLLLSDIPPASKLIGWWVLAGNLHCREAEIRYTDTSRKLGIDPSNLRKSARKLDACFDLSCRPGSLTLRWCSPLCSEYQLERLEMLEQADVRHAGLFLDLIDPDRRSVNHARETPATSELRKDGPVNHARESPALPSSLRNSPENRVHGAHDLPISATSVPHNDNDNSDDMLCGSEGEGDQAVRVLTREQSIRSFGEWIDFRETDLYLIRAWALMVETERVLVRSRLLKLDGEFLDSLLDRAAKERKLGGYITNAIYNRLKLDKSDTPKWRNIAEQVSIEIGLPFGRDLRDKKVGGEAPAPPSRPPAQSRAPRGGDGADPNNLLRFKAVAQLQKEQCVTREEANAMVDEAIRQGLELK